MKMIVVKVVKRNDALNLAFPVLLVDVFRLPLEREAESRRNVTVSLDHRFAGMI